MKKVIVDCRISHKCEKSLMELGYTPIKLPPFKKLPTPVSSHPDMLLFLYSDKLFCHREYYLTAKKEIEGIGKEVVLSDEPVENIYPRDILFNAALAGNTLIGNLRHLSSYIKELPLTQLNVKQGYAKCSTCVVSENAIITADSSIGSAAKGAGIDVLNIPSGHISLPGYDAGFIGGASGATEDFVAFCGNIDLHPAANEIKAFCKKHEKKVISLSDEALFDVGTLFFI